jgi:hypothetical protein
MKTKLALLLVLAGTTLWATSAELRRARADRHSAELVEHYEGKLQQQKWLASEQRGSESRAAEYEKEVALVDAELAKARTDAERQELMAKRSKLVREHYQPGQ